MNWNLEGKVAGYNKKTLAIVVLVILAGVFFFAGTRYEKMKLSHLNNSPASVGNSVKKTGPKKQPVPAQQQPNVNADNNATANNTVPAPAENNTTTTPVPVQK